MLSPEIQYMIFAGTKKGDFTGWEKTIQNQGDIIDCWTLELGNGYFLDRLTRRVRRFMRTREQGVIGVRRDCTVEDPEGPYRDVDVSVLMDVMIIVTEDAVKLEDRHSSFVMLSREPVDWNSFENGRPDFGRKESEENWSSFYR